MTAPLHLFAPAPTALPTEELAVLGDTGVYAVETVEIVSRDPYTCRVGTRVFVFSPEQVEERRRLVEPIRRWAVREKAYAERRKA